jgi:hypothetical protein
MIINDDNINVGPFIPSTSSEDLGCPKLNVEQAKY